MRYSQFKVALLVASHLLFCCFNNVASADPLPSEIKIDRSITPSKTISEFVVNYIFEEIALSPGHAIEIILPKVHASTPLDLIQISHRQAPEANLPRDKHDATSGLLAVLVHEPTFSDAQQWRFWNGDASGKWGAKFAEARESAARAEIDNLYDWQVYGTRAVKDPLAAIDFRAINPDRVAIASIGSDIVYLSKVAVKWRFSPTLVFQEKKFAPWLNFGEVKTGKGKSINGNLEDGIRVMPLESGDKIEEKERHGFEGARVFRSYVEIPLPSHGSISSAEFACGDGKFGNAQVSVVIIRNDGSQIPIFANENVPPVAMMSADIPDGKVKLKGGDLLRVTTTKHKLYLLGVRLGIN